jgi:hypothetical protein
MQPNYKPFARISTSKHSTTAQETGIPTILIVFNKGHCSLGCQILDVSDTGALVMPADMFLCPRDEFVLKPRVGSSRDCEVVWRKMDKVGVRFI